MRALRLIVLALVVLLAVGMVSAAGLRIKEFQIENGNGSCLYLPDPPGTIGGIETKNLPEKFAFKYEDWMHIDLIIENTDPSQGYCTDIRARLERLVKQPDGSSSWEPVPGATGWPIITSGGGAVTKNVILAGEERHFPTYGGGKYAAHRPCYQVPEPSAVYGPGGSMIWINDSTYRLSVSLNGVTEYDEAIDTCTHVAASPEHPDASSTKFLITGKPTSVPELPFWLVPIMLAGVLFVIYRRR